jgi:gamma-glutamyltranspeptidase/glutathione hydrolase
MGGEFQPQILLQVLSRVFAGATPQQAVDAPRWTIGPWDRGESSDTLSWEPGLESTVVSQLSRWPGPSRRLDKGSPRVGHAQAVRVVDGQIECGTDPRADP